MCRGPSGLSAGHSPHIRCRATAPKSTSVILRTRTRESKENVRMEITRMQCQVPGCTLSATGFVARGEIYLGRPQHPSQTGLCNAHLKGVVERDLRSVVRAS